MAVLHSDELATLILGDALSEPAWLSADVLVTDPPYGRRWRQGNLKPAHMRSDARAGIAGDESCALRDGALELWGPERPAIVFGDLMLCPPAGTRQVLIYAKPLDAGTRGATGGYRRDAEAIYLLGPWPSGIGGRSSVLRSAIPTAGNPYGISARAGGHPHAKPGDVMAQLIEHTAGTVADPFAGSGSTLVAAKRLGRRSIGVEIEPKYARMAARRLAQDTLQEADDG